MNRLALPTVTLCAAASVNVVATLAALRACAKEVRFAECLLFTDRTDLPTGPDIRIVPIQRLTSSAEYSRFLLSRLIDHVQTSHCLVAQWDGFVLDASSWDHGFLDYDYIGAAWPQFDDGHDVGNGGFSLRSRKLLEACLDPRFRGGHPEDVAICRTNRVFLEREHGIRFADRASADRFSFERCLPRESTFGFHGVFNMIDAVGAERFWEIYRILDDRRTAFVDYRRIMGQFSNQPGATAKRARLTMDRLKHRMRRSNV